MPVLVARARKPQEVLGVSVPRGGLVVLDVYGTDHDPATWPQPEPFDPAASSMPPFDPDGLVPQGGGDVTTGHRCPGEGITLTMLQVAVQALACTPHTVPTQDLSDDLSRVPTRLRSGVVLQGPVTSVPGDRS